MFFAGAVSVRLTAVRYAASIAGTLDSPVGQPSVGSSQ